MSRFETSQWPVGIRSALLGSIAACGLASAALAQGIVYDTDVVNDGAPITLEYWTPYGWGFQQDWIDAYTERHPNVTINLQSQPWGDYWNKLPVALRNADGPDIIGMHIGWASSLANMLEPWPIDFEDLDADYALSWSNMVGDNILFMNMSVIHGGIFYNKKHWTAAGLTEADIPETWDELRDVANRLTLRNEAGQMTQAGFCYQGAFRDLLVDLNYQTGTWNFSPDGTSAEMNKPAVLKNLEFMVSLYDDDGLCDPIIAETNWEGMGQERIAMGYVYNWVGGWLDANSNVDWGWFPAPVFEGAPAIGRNNVENSFAVSAASPDDKKAVALDFVRFVISEEDLVLQQVLETGGVPTLRSLLDHPLVLENPIAAESIARNMIESTVYGPIPVAWEAGYDYVRDIVVDGGDLATALAEGEAIANRRLSGLGFVSAERDYPNAQAFGE
ncbi:MAG: extracellular solute-binding protein [Rubellimicrobium sp.]|nr:extracellular solute-binding protein [Rubellimicrobium sp.]